LLSNINKIIKEVWGQGGGSRVVKPGERYSIGQSRDECTRETQQLQGCSWLQKQPNWCHVVSYKSEYQDRERIRWNQGHEYIDMRMGLR
jgi:hypothetical protein